MKFIDIGQLRPIEEHSSKRVLNIHKKMESKGIWERPISIEINNMLILDGHHRYQVAKLFEFNYIPCELFSYSDSGVEVWSLRKDCEVSKDLVIQRALSGNIYPYKTAKHKFPRIVEKCFLEISFLKSLNRSNIQDFGDI